MKDAKTEIETKYISNKPTINVTIIIDEEAPEKSTFLIDFDKRLQIKKESWDEFNNKTKLSIMLQQLKFVLPTMLINSDKEEFKLPVKEETF